MATNELEKQDQLEPNYAANTVEDDDEEEEEEDDDSSMTLIEHLEELRWRIFKSLIAIAVGSVVAFIFRVQILTLLELPLPKMAADTLTHGKLVVSGLTEGFTVYLMISIAFGFILVLPVVLYQTWAFIAPGLLVKEKKIRRTLHLCRGDSLRGRGYGGVLRFTISGAVVYNVCLG